jgi:hypothetical protein
VKILLLADYQDQQLRLARGEQVEVGETLGLELARAGLAKIVARGAAVKVMHKPDGDTLAIKRRAEHGDH